MVKHARGGRPDVSEGKGGLYLAGRMQKAMFPTLVDNATSEEQERIDLSFNRARIDGIWLALGLLSCYCTFDEIAEKYVNLSYAADKRVERANKSQSLLEKNYEYYEQMLRPILTCFVNKGIIEPVAERVDLFEKKISLAKGDIEKWLKECSKDALKVNIGFNIWTMGPFNGLGYEAEKVKRIIPWLG